MAAVAHLWRNASQCSSVHVRMRGRDRKRRRVVVSLASLPWPLQRRILLWRVLFHGLTWLLLSDVRKENIARRRIELGSWRPHIQGSVQASLGDLGGRNSAR